MDLGETKHSNRPDIYIASMTSESLAPRVRQCLPGVKVVDMKLKPSGQLSPDDVDILKNNAEVVFCSLQLVKNIIGDMKKVKLIQALSAGVNVVNMDLEAAPSFRLTRMTQNCSIVAEYVITHILAREKQLVSMFESQKSCQWQQLKFATKRHIGETRICIIGVGTIGQAVARHCKRFGMFVYGVTRTDKPDVEHSDLIDEYHTLETLPHILQSVDYICCCLPSTPETTDMLSGDVLSACKPKVLKLLLKLYWKIAGEPDDTKNLGGTERREQIIINRTGKVAVNRKKPILVNIGRGTLINEETLVRALKDGWLGGAVLDVLPKEPLPANSELWVLPNVTITPHISGYNRDKKMLDRFVSEFVENYKRYCEGKHLTNEVEFDRHY